MPRTATTFDSTPEGRERARQIRLRHGAKSDAVVEPRAKKTYRRLAALLPKLPAKQRPLLHLLASAITKRELMDEFFERRGLVDGKDRLDGGANFWAECARLELSLMERLKMTEPPESNLAAILRQTMEGRR